jgi:hypothetical protein
MRLWRWLRRRTTPAAPRCAGPVRDPDDPDDVLRDIRHQREIREHRERMQQLSDELSLIRRDEGHRS